MARIFLLHNAFTGSGAAWSAQFDLPQEPPEGRSDKIYFFAPPQSCGGELIANGHLCAQFRAGERIFIDLTGDLTEERANRIDVFFYENHIWQGEVGLRMVSFAYFEDVRCETAPGVLYLHLTLCAQVRGTYRLRLRVHQKEDPIAGFNVDLSLIAAAQKLTVQVPMPDAVPWRPGQESAAYLVRLFLQRGGLGCDSAQTACAFGSLHIENDLLHDGRKPLFLSAAHAQDEDFSALPLWQRAGINAVILPEFSGSAFLHACLCAGLIPLRADGTLYPAGLAAEKYAAQAIRPVPLGIGRPARAQLLRSRINSLRMMQAAGVILLPQDIPLCADALYTPCVWLSLNRQSDILSGRAMALLPDGFTGRLYVQTRLFDAAGVRLCEMTFQPQVVSGGLVTCGRFETACTQAALAHVSIYLGGRMIAFCSQQLKEAPPALCESVRFIRSGGVCYVCNDSADLLCGLHLYTADGQPLLTAPAIIDLRPWEKLPVQVLWPGEIPKDVRIHAL